MRSRSRRQADAGFGGVPLYNKERTVLRTLASIAAQDCTDFEAIIVDDGSTDGGDAVAEAFPDPRFRLIRQANAGPGAARNTGIAAARADFIAFLDADDVWSPDYLSAAITGLEANPEVASVTAGYREMPGGASTEPMWLRGEACGQGSSRSRRTRRQRLPPPFSPTCRPAARSFAPTSSGVTADSTPRTAASMARSASVPEAAAQPSGASGSRAAGNDPRDDSGLSANLPAARPVEPFLLNAEEIRVACPPALAPLLERLLALRAFKTACMLGYWGEWRRARELRRRFARTAGRGLPYRFASLACATPLATPLGRGSTRLPTRVTRRGVRSGWDADHRHQALNRSVARNGPAKRRA